MRRRRCVKIVATLGPASQEREMIHRLFEAGVDVFRINMSHADHATLKTYVQTIRSVEAALQRPIGILVDLQGPKLRLGTIVGGKVVLAPNTRIHLVLDQAQSDATHLCLPHPEVFTVLKPDMPLLLDDGKVRLRIESAEATQAVARVEVGGPLSDHKGVNVPGTVLPIEALSAKDREDMAQALALEVDWIALSFVQRPDDVAQARTLVAGQAGVMVKLEKPAALDCLDEILALADAVMVARGDLGVEIPLQQVPGWQKQIVRAARRVGKPVVVATQMLESMLKSPMPTRSDVSDVATAVFEGTDAVMLSAETATGDYPVETVAMMDSIAYEVESDMHYRSVIDAQRQEPEATTPDAIMAAARQVAQTLHVAAIVCWTSSGATGLRAARERPSVPIIALTPVPATGRRLACTWGLHCVLAEDAYNFEDMVERACRIASLEGFASAGQSIVITAGVPLGTPGATNLLRISVVEPPAAVAA